MSPTAEATPGSAPLRRPLVFLFALACGISAANLYYAQPVLGSIATSFHTSSSNVGLIVTFAQIGYAIGLAFIIPLGDMLPRRRLVPSVLLITVVGLFVSAFAPNVGVLVAITLVVGLGSVAAQLLVPMAASLSSDHERGRVVGMVMSGLLLGILLARSVSGVIAQLSSWRAVYVIAALMTLALALVLSRLLPPERERPTVRYAELLRGAVHYFATESLLRRRALFGALGFGAFSVFWTTMAFLLSGAPYHYNDLTIGLFGLIGAAGALCANFAGRWADRRWTKPTTLVFAALMAFSFLPLWLGRHSLALVIVGILILDVGAQGLQVTNQSLIYRLAPHARSRINSSYMVCYFLGGALGSWIGSMTYEHFRWTGVCVLGGAIGLAATALAIADSLNKTPHPDPMSAAPAVTATTSST
ncbi:MAG: MFS transporter [Acidimicrobiales bacterium]